MYVYMRVACVCACARVCVCVYSLYAFVRIPIWNNEILMAIVVRWHLKPLSIQSMAERKTDRRGRLHCLGILLKTSSFSTAAADDDGIAGDDARFHLSAAEDASAVSMALSHSLTVWCTSLPHQTKISRSHCLLSLLSLLIVGCCRHWCDAAAAAMIGAVRWRRRLRKMLYQQQQQQTTLNCVGLCFSSKQRTRIAIRRRNSWNPLHRLSSGTHTQQPIHNI